MKRTTWLAALSLFSLVAPARADVVIQSPYILLRFGQPGIPAFGFGLPGGFSVQVSRPIGMTASQVSPVPTMPAPPGSPERIPAPAPLGSTPVPGIRIQAEPGPPAPVVSTPAPVNRLPADTVPLVPQPSPVPEPAPASLASRPVTIEEFAASFQPAPGDYQVVFLHPRTHAPVTVCFTLPPGSPRKICVQRRDLVFDYGRNEVRIRFLLLGRTRVLYD